MSYQDSIIISSADINDLTQQTADYISQWINQILQVKPEITMAISVGKNIIPLLNLFKERNDIPWQDVHVFTLSEKLVKIDSDNSNFKFVYDSFIKFLIQNQVLELKNVHPFNYTQNQAIDLESYTKELLKFGESFDIIICALEDDGHIADLYPSHSSIKDDNEFFTIIDDAPVEPRLRITATKKLILKSSVGILFGTNVNSDVITKLQNPNVNFYECPAKLILELPNSVVASN